MELMIDHANLCQNIEVKTIFYAHERQTRDSLGFLCFGTTSIQFLRNRGGRLPQLSEFECGNSTLC